jgi:hypothetical protein
MSKALAKTVKWELVTTRDVPLHNLYHRKAALLAAQGVGFLVMAGLQLKAEKKKAGHGKWETWVEGNCDYDVRTAQRYMKLADGVKGRALKNDNVSFFKLLESTPADLTPTQQEKLLAAVNKLTDGETLASLYEGFGILKLPAGAGLRGKKRKHTASGSDVNDPAEVARDLWKPTIDFLEQEGVERCSFKDLPMVELNRLRDAMLDLSRQLKGKAK